MNQVDPLPSLAQNIQHWWDNGLSEIDRKILKIGLFVFSTCLSLFCYDLIGWFLRKDVIHISELIISGALSAFCFNNSINQEAESISDIASHGLSMMGLFSFFRAWTTGYRAVLEERAIGIPTWIMGTYALVTLAYRIFSPEILAYLRSSREQPV